MKRIIPVQDDDDDDEGLTMEKLQETASSRNGGAWILRCPKDVSESRCIIILFESV